MRRTRIGSLRRECVDHLIVWIERSLRRHLQQYLAYYHEWRTHLSLDKDAPVPRAEHAPACGAIVAVPHVGGLHHHYERRAPDLARSAADRLPSFGGVSHGVSTGDRRVRTGHPRVFKVLGAGCWRPGRHTIGRSFTGWSFW